MLLGGSKYQSLRLSKGAESITDIHLFGRLITFAVVVCVWISFEQLANSNVSNGNLPIKIFVTLISV